MNLQEIDNVEETQLSLDDSEQVLEQNNENDETLDTDTGENSSENGSENDSENTETGETIDGENNGQEEVNDPDPHNTGKAPAPKWLKDLREISRKAKRQILERDEALKAAQKDLEELSVLVPNVEINKPKLDDFELEYGHDRELMQTRYDEALLEYNKKIEVKSKSAQIAESAKRRNEEVMKNCFDHYKKSADSLEKTHSISRENIKKRADIVESSLTNQQVVWLLRTCEANKINTAQIISALATNSPVHLNALAGDFDPITFSSKIVAYGAKLSATKQRKPAQDQSVSKPSGSISKSMQSKDPNELFLKGKIDFKTMQKMRLEQRRSK